MKPQHSTSRPTAPPDDAPQRRKEREAAPAGTVGVGQDDSAAASPSKRAATPTRRSEEHREEVVGQGSGETAGGSPATAKGDKKAAKRPAILAAEVSFDPEEFAQGGVYSNTPPSIPNHNENNSLSSPISTGGEDTLEINLYLNHREPGQLFRQLDRMRNAAEAGDKTRDEWEVGGVRMLCLAGSASAGGGAKRISYRWRLQSETGLVLLLMQRPSAHPTLPNGILRIGSVPLMRFGTMGCYQQALKWLTAIGAQLERNKLGRADPCSDLPGVVVSTFCEPFSLGHYVSKVRNSARYRGEIPLGEFATKREDRGFKIGSGAAMLRVYDKLHETRHDSEKRQLLIARRWGYLPEAATRAELQLRRLVLKRFGVDSFEDWIERRAAILSNMTGEWFRFSDGPVDPKHPDRSGVLPAWASVQHAFCDWAGDAVDVRLAPLPRGEVNAEHMSRQLYGVAMSTLVRAGREPSTIDQFAHESNFMMLNIAEGRNVAEDYRRKVLELGLGEM